MQRGIDSFFKRIPPANKQNGATESPAPSKRKALVISSDEEEIPESPHVSKSKSKKDHKKTKLDKTPKKKPSLNRLKKSPKDLKKVDPNALFGGELKRVEAKKPPKPVDPSTLELEDDEINQSLMDVDVDDKALGETKSSRLEVPSANENKTESRKSPQKNENPSPVKDSNSASSSKTNNKTPKKTNKTSSKTDKNKTPISKEKTSLDLKGDQEVEMKKITSSSEKKKPIHKTPKSEKKEKSHSKKEHSDLETSVLSDEERHERKRMAAILFQKFKNRSSCLNHGCKEIPKGKPDCLSGLTFLVTGVLESLERDECASVIKEYGGKVMSTVGKRLNYLIVGEDAGPKKLAQAEEMNIKILSEDGFFDLIRERSDLAPDTSSNVDVKMKDKIKEEKLLTSPNIKKKNKERHSEIKIKQESPSPVKRPKLDKSQEMNNNFSSTNVKPKKESDPEKPKPLETTNSATVVGDELLAWVDKYKPTSVKEIIGQQGAASNVAKLINWLSKWYSNHDGKKKLQKPNPWAKNDDGSYYKAALLSGPPGIGKTTTAMLVCKELGFDIVEFNASDTRSKKLLKQEISELLSNKSLYGYFHGKADTVSKKHVLIMDEVDGMAGNEDRGGIQELMSLIKESSVPIICMCNDRNHQKMRSLVNYCYDLRFNKPRLEQIKARILSICFKEKLKMDPHKIEEIIAATNNDIRQSINHISLLSAGKSLNLPTDSPKSEQKIAEKDLKLGPWEVVRKVFSADEHKKMTFYDKCDLFFHDYSLAPLFVQQNYLQVSPSGSKSELMKKIAATAESLSLGDLVDKKIRTNSAWSLLPTQGIFSSVLPGEYMCGYFTGQINFPGWLGKNSNNTKRSRLAQEIHDHTRLRTSGSRLSIRLDYAPFLLGKIVRPLKERGLDGVEESLDVIKEYHLLREDIDSLIELTTWPGRKGLWDSVDGKVKAALTRSYNKEVMAYSYSVHAGVKKKKAANSDDVELLGIEGEEGEGKAVNASDDEDNNDDLENDGLIKAKKKTTSSKATTSKAATSKAAGGNKKATTASKGKGKKV